MSRQVEPGGHAIVPLQCSEMEGICDEIATDHYFSTTDIRLCENSFGVAFPAATTEYNDNSGLMAHFHNANLTLPTILSAGGCASKNEGVLVNPLKRKSCSRLCGVNALI